MHRVNDWTARAKAPGQNAANDTFDLQPTLQGATLVLRPLCATDFDSLYAAASDPLIWEQNPEPTRYKRDVFEKFFTSGMASGGALLAVDNASQQVIGSSRYYDWNSARQEVAIGYTFLVRSHWGGAANREMKTLMLDHAFKCAKQVWFHIGVNNVRSRKAMAKIGGVYSHDEPTAVNGIMRDYAFYRIVNPRAV